MKKSLLTAPMLCFGFAAPAVSDVVYADDVIITKDLCVGSNDCVDGEVFGAVDIKIKSANPEILLDDTTSGSANDWSLKGDDNSAGATDSFSISNSSTGSIPFAIAPGAPSSALWISETGYVGIGTILPQNELHVAGALNPEITIQRTQSPSYSWDIGGSFLGFYVQDATAGTLPFNIEDAAPDYALTIASNGDVGLSTNTGNGNNGIAAPLHIKRTDGSSKILVEETGGSGAQELFQMKSNGGSYFTLTNTTSGRDWFFTHENAAQGRFIITSSTNPSEGLFLTPDGNMTIGGTLTTGGGTCGGGCDAVFTESYAVPTIEQHAEAMWALGYLPNVGPTPENTPINVSDKLGRMLNELEHAHIYIDQLHEEIAALKSDQAQQNARFARIEAALAQTHPPE